MLLLPAKHLRRMGPPLNPAFADDWNTLHTYKALACLPRPDARFQSRVRGFNSGIGQSFFRPQIWNQ